MKKPNAQDATRKYDIAPLRRRIVALEQSLRAYKKDSDKKFRLIVQSLDKLVTRKG